MSLFFIVLLSIIQEWTLTEMRYLSFYRALPRREPIDQFRCIKIQPKTIDLSTRLWGITTEFVGLIPQSLILRSIVLG